MGIKYINVRPDTIKTLRGKHRQNILRKFFFNLPPRAMKFKTKINKWDQIHHKRFAQQRKP